MAEYYEQGAMVGGIVGVYSELGPLILLDGVAIIFQIQGFMVGTPLWCQISLQHPACPRLAHIIQADMPRRNTTFVSEDIVKAKMKVSPVFAAYILHIYVAQPFQGSASACCPNSASVPMTSISIGVVFTSYVTIVCKDRWK